MNPPAGPNDLASAERPAESVGVPGERPPSVRRKHLQNIATALLALALLAAAIYTVARHSHAASSAITAARTAPPWAVALLFLLPLINIASITLGFWIMTERYARIRAGEMLALITSGWMLNNLPLRPGLLGRVAYHKLVNGIPVRASVKVLLQMIACAGIALGVLLSVLWMAHTFALSAVAAASVAGGAIVFCILLAMVLRDRPDDHLWRWPAGVACRLLDIIVWAARYALLFYVFGAPIPLLRAGIIAAVSQAAMLSPVQVGLREWVVGVTSAWLATPVNTPSSDVALGLMVDLANRGIEVLLGVPLGLVATLWLVRRVRQHARSLAARTHAAS